VSQENVQLIRAAFDAFAADGLDAALPFFAPDCVWHPSDHWVDGSASRGHDGIRALVAAWDENFDDFRWNVHDIRDAQDRVVVLTHMTGRIKDSGLPLSQPLGLVASDFRGETFGDVQVFATWDEALEAVGLGE
jgi:ketosteroid isomerase-like protein